MHVDALDGEVVRVCRREMYGSVSKRKWVVEGVWVVEERARGSGVFIYAWEVARDCLSPVTCMTTRPRARANARQTDM